MLTFLSVALTALTLFTPVQDAAGPRAQSPGLADPEAAALMIRGLTQHRLANYDIALAAFKEALRLVQDTTRGSADDERDRNAATLNSALADVYLDLDDRASSLYYTRLALALDPRAEFAVRVAELLMRGGESDAAIALLEQFGAVHSDEDSQRIIAEARHRFSEQSPAEVAREPALPEGGHPLLEQAMSSLNEGRPDLAIEPLEGLLTMSARDVNVWTLLARARFESGDAEGAAATAADGLILFPGSTDLIVSAIRVERARPTTTVLTRSAAQLVELADEKPPHEAAQLRAHLAWGGQEGPDGFRAALVLDPDNPLALAALALAAIRSGDAEQARQRLSRLPEADSVAWEVGADAGLAWSLLGDVQAAARYLNRASESPYASVELLTTAGDMAFELGESASARSLWRRALELAPTDAALLDRLNR